jgi:hypothetical protein
MNHVFHRHSRVTPPVAVGGKGPYLIDADGKHYLDASGGAAVSNLGHGHPTVIQAIKDQLDRLAYAHTAFFSNTPAEELADFLVESAPGLDRVYFVDSGSEAIECALKLARQYFLEIGQPQRSRFIARRQSYHGNTLGALAVGGNEWRRRPFKPLLIESHHISPCYAYRNRRADETDSAYGLRAANELETMIQKLGADSVLAFIAETVVGATLGAVPPVSGYFKRIREICDRHGVLLILDEVMCGSGRTGTLFAYEQEDIRPDMVAIAKGLGGGYQPIGATMVTEKIHNAVRDGSGFFQHGHTYMCHATACAAALAVQTAIRDERLLEHVNRQGDRLAAALAQRLANHAHVGDIRGRGLFLGVELVEDRASKKPFDPDRRLHAAVKRQAMARGLLCYPMGGTVDGRLGDHILLAPPFIINDDHTVEIVDKLAAAVDAAVAELPS